MTGKKNHTQNVHLKLIPCPFLNFGWIKQNSHCMLKIRYFERGLSESLTKVNFILLSNPLPFNGQDYMEHLSFWSGKSNEEGEKLQKFEYLWKRKELFYLKT